MNRLYILIRSDLSVSYQAVQAGHVVAQYVLDYPESQWKNDYLIYLSVRDEDELKHWNWKLEKLGH